VRYLYVLPVVAKRLLSRLPLSLLLCATMALSVAIAVSIPAFANAVGLRIMWEEYGQHLSGRGLARFYVRVIAHPRDGYALGIDDAVEVEAWLGRVLRSTLNLPVLTSNVEVTSPEYLLAPRADDTRYAVDYLGTVRIRHVSDLTGRVTFPQGEPFGDTVNVEILDVWLAPSYLERLAVQVGEVYELVERRAEAEIRVPVRIAGTWEPLDFEDIFWHRPFTSRTYGILFTTAGGYGYHIAAKLPEKARSITFHYVLDEGHVNLSRADKYIAQLESLDEVLGSLPGAWTEVSPSGRLLQGQSRRQSFSLMLFGFSFLTLSVLVYFIALLSAMQARFQEGENAVLVSRGSTAAHLLVLAAAESLILGALAMPLGIGLGLFLTQLLGAADGFLSFVAREPVRLSLYVINWPPVLAIAGVNLGVRLYAAWKSGRTTVVGYSQFRARVQALQMSSMSAILRRLFYASLILLVTVYAYRQLRSQGSLAVMSLNAFDPRTDPLILLAPSLFLLTVPLFAIEIFALLARALGSVGTYLPGVSCYLALRNLARDSGYYRITIFLLVLCLSMGSFYASMAKSADLWLTDSRRHAHGTDLTFEVGIIEDDRGSAVRPAVLADIPTVPLDEYRALPGVGDAARTGKFDAYAVGVAARRDRPKVEILAVDRADFARVAYFRQDYAPQPLGELMNRLAERPNGALLSVETADEFMLNPGDAFQLSVKLIGETWVELDFVLVGTFSHFPTLYPGGDPVAVTDLAALEARTLGLLPYRVWLQLEPGVDGDTVIGMVRSMGVKPGLIENLGSVLEREGQRLERSGIFGLLSICFLAGAALAVANLIVSSTLMLRDRAITYAVLRAIGVDRWNVLKAVAVEGLFTLIYGLAVGLGAGILCARLYVSYFPLSSVPGIPIPPFIAVIDQEGALGIGIIVVGAMVLAQVGVLAYMLRMRLFEVLRLGERA
jgi:putative ABC transport system permease protein